ncbi:hypothetical protein PGT21_006324 [Puccinia graminis f. sp. tritici]|uniref:Uncharacterized protein n=1 Tax=Puccinia graminis f. sp. tritici TaxID=56615 RepID=A0A5B0NMN4_PUCGR|nr:hypothetical protein PGT21_006324 [Puccinia graminis f. sp. tritici]
MIPATPASCLECLKAIIIPNQGGSDMWTQQLATYDHQRSTSPIFKSLDRPHITHRQHLHLTPLASLTSSLTSHHSPLADIAPPNLTQ